MSNSIRRRDAAFALLAVAVAVALISCSTTSAVAQTKSAAVPPTTTAPDSPLGPGSAGGETAKKTATEWLIESAVSRPNSPQYADVEDAVTRFANGKAEEARDLLTRARQKDPKLPPVEVLMGRMWAQAGYPAQGRAELEKAVTAYPNDPDAYLFFAEAALMERRISDGAALLQEVKPLIEKFTDNQKRKNSFEVRLNAGMASTLR